VAVMVSQTSASAATVAEKAKNEGCIGPPVLLTNAGLLRCTVKDGTHYFNCSGCDLSGVDVSLLPPPTTPRVGVVIGPPTILPQCADPPTSKEAAFVGAGPSPLARECTRQYCAQPEYQAKATTYAMKRPQSESAQLEALTCISRAEEDRSAK
jgi:hypothetical protein